MNVLSLLRTIALLLAASCALHAQCPNKAGAGQYQIKSGDNLYRISKANQISLADICKWNGLTIYDTLKVCSIIFIQNPTSITTTAAAPITYSSTAASSVPEASLTSKGIRQAGQKHTVQAGETVASIAALYGYTEWRYRQFNALSAQDEVTPGSVLLTTDCACTPLMLDGWPNISNSESVSVQPITHSTKWEASVPENYKPAEAAVSKPTPTVAPTAQRNQTNQMSQLERDMVAEINLMRSNPSAYVQYVEQYQRESMIPASAQTAAELIAELRSLRPLSVLTPSDCLYDAAKWHAETQRPKGDIDHQGTDGSWPWDRAKRYCPSMNDGNENIVGGPKSVRSSVIVLLLDEGIPTRGHRKNLLNPAWKYVACYGAGTVGTMPNCYVQMFGE